MKETNPEEGFLGHDLDKGDTIAYQEQKEDYNCYSE